MAALLFAYGKSRFSDDVANIRKFFILDIRTMEENITERCKGIQLINGIDSHRSVWGMVLGNL